METGIPLMGAPQSHHGLKYSTVTFDSGRLQSGSGMAQRRYESGIGTGGKSLILFRFLEPAAALARAQVLLHAGAGLLDLGAESTRPGAAPTKRPPRPPLTTWPGPARSKAMRRPV